MGWLAEMRGCCPSPLAARDGEGAKGRPHVCVFVRASERSFVELPPPPTAAPDSPRAPPTPAPRPLVGRERRARTESWRTDLALARNPRGPLSSQIGRRTQESRLSESLALPPPSFPAQQRPSDPRGPRLPRQAARSSSSSQFLSRKRTQASGLPL